MKIRVKRSFDKEKDCFLYEIKADKTARNLLNKMFLKETTETDIKDINGETVIRRLVPRVVADRTAYILAQENLVNKGVSLFYLSDDLDLFRELVSSIPRKIKEFLQVLKVEIEEIKIEEGVAKNED